MIFAWDQLNREHIAEHDVSPDEAEQVARAAQSPFPRAMGEGKYMVWGQTAVGRYLQVIFVFKTPDEVDFESLTTEQWSEVQAGSVK